MSVKQYENRQAGYTDRYTVEYRRKDDGTIDIFVPVCPKDPHGNGAEVHHRYASGRICIADGKAPRSLEMAEAVAHYWMSGYSRYVRTGKFDDSGGTVNV